MFPSKEQRVENRGRVKEQSHWTSFFLLATGIFMNNGFLLDRSDSVVFWNVIIGMIAGLIPLFFIWRARKSQMKRRRLATKNATTVSFSLVAILLLSFLLGLFRVDELSTTRILAGILAITYWTIIGLICRFVYKQLVNYQGVSAKEDNLTKKQRKTEIGLATSVSVVGIGAYFYLVL